MADNKKKEELIPVQLFKDNNRYKDDVTVHVNGQRMTIQRGKPVEIPAKYAEALQHSLTQDAVAADYAAAKQEEFRSNKF